VVKQAPYVALLAAMAALAESRLKAGAATVSVFAVSLVQEESKAEITVAVRKSFFIIYFLCRVNVILIKDQHNVGSGYFGHFIFITFSRRLIPFKKQVLTDELILL
jgi:hypothetical protein